MSVVSKLQPQCDCSALNESLSKIMFVDLNTIMCMS